MKIIGYVVVLGILIFLGITWAGYALSLLWSWILVDSFGIPSISIPQAIGITMIVTYMTHQDYDIKNNKEGMDVLIEYSIKAAVKPAVSILFGWILTFWL